MNSTQHYNALSRGGGKKTDRAISPIIHELSMNNWIKSVLFLNTLTTPDSIVVELGCGRGGDLTKYRHHHLTGIIGIDNSSDSLEEFKRRYTDSFADSFRAKLIEGDFTVHGFSSLIPAPVQFISSQFAMHYAFESSETVTRYFSTVSKLLRPAGTFVATIPNAIQIVNGVQSHPSRRCFGNRFFCISFDRPHFPRYGAKYRFRLDSAVNADEFLIHPTIIERQAKRHQLTIKEITPFPDYYQKNIEPRGGKTEHSEECVSLLKVHRVYESGEWKKDEAEIVSLYSVLVMKKNGQDDGQFTNAQFTWDDEVSIRSAEEANNKAFLSTRKPPTSDGTLFGKPTRQILSRIFSLLSHTDMLRCKQVCQKWRSINLCEWLMKPVAPPKPPATNQPTLPPVPPPHPATNTANPLPFNLLPLPKFVGQPTQTMPQQNKPPPMPIQTQQQTPITNPLTHITHPGPISSAHYFFPPLQFEMSESRISLSPTYINKSIVTSPRHRNVFTLLTDHHLKMKGYLQQPKHLKHMVKFANYTQRVPSRNGMAFGLPLPDVLMPKSVIYGLDLAPTGKCSNIACGIEASEHGQVSDMSPVIVDDQFIQLVLQECQMTTNVFAPNPNPHPFFIPDGSCSITELYMPTVVLDPHSINESHYVPFEGQTTFHPYFNYNTATKPKLKGGGERVGLSLDFLNAFLRIKETGGSTSSLTHLSIPLVFVQNTSSFTALPCCHNLVQLDLTSPSDSVAKNFKQAILDDNKRITADRPFLQFLIQQHSVSVDGQPREFSPNSSGNMTYFLRMVMDSKIDPTGKSIDTLVNLTSLTLPLFMIHQFFAAAHNSLPNITSLVFTEDPTLTSKSNHTISHICHSDLYGEARQIGLLHEIRHDPSFNDITATVVSRSFIQNHPHLALFMTGSDTLWTDAAVLEYVQLRKASDQNQAEPKELQKRARLLPVSGVKLNCSLVSSDTIRSLGELKTLRHVSLQHLRLSAIPSLSSLATCENLTSLSLSFDFTPADEEQEIMDQRMSSRTLDSYSSVFSFTQPMSRLKDVLIQIAYSCPFVTSFSLHLHDLRDPEDVMDQQERSRKLPPRPLPNALFLNLLHCWPHITCLSISGFFVKGDTLQLLSSLGESIRTLVIQSYAAFFPTHEYVNMQIALLINSFHFHRLASFGHDHQFSEQKCDLFVGVPNNTLPLDAFDELENGSLFADLLRENEAWHDEEKKKDIVRGWQKQYTRKLHLNQHQSDKAFQQLVYQLFFRLRFLSTLSIVGFGTTFRKHLSDEVRIGTNERERALNQNRQGPAPLVLTTLEWVDPFLGGERHPIPIYPDTNLIDLLDVTLQNLEKEKYIVH
ncbi:putative mRNA cap guanine-N7 methyltransferase [Blattamonas nauphoetae]|uniref:mRNA (guanine-N(7))-methyltransferase n=1 Tax=Blattamonas nauphoetae TaxID=2049346 RepID=A0ABQ9X3V7_9EUKA|nr:putative mRNA cap guanine-N7 methyltransferase [Blattamonas nauphoetae]